MLNAPHESRNCVLSTHALVAGSFTMCIAVQTFPNFTFFSLSLYSVLCKSQNVSLSVPSQTKPISVGVTRDRDM